MTKSNNKSVQAKIDELQAITEWFDSENFVLDQSVDKFKLAESLAKEIEADLTQLKNEINVIAEKFDRQ